MLEWEYDSAEGCCQMLCCCYDSSGIVDVVKVLVGCPDCLCVTIEEFTILGEPAVPYNITVAVELLRQLGRVKLLCATRAVL
jgi:hypothetical protein